MKTKFAIIIYFTFILFTIIGTLTHEFGHFIVGRYLGSKTSIHYGYTSSSGNALDDRIFKIITKNEKAIDLKKGDFPEKEEFERLKIQSSKNKFWMILGGPFQTMLTGTIGFILVLMIRKRHQYASKFAHWICLFLALFWFRQPTNLVSWILSKPFNGKYSTSGDEIRLARYLELPQETIIWVTGVLGLLTGGYTIVKFVPRNKLMIFCISGFLGGISGFILWLKILGPIILP
jgi:hypothetical protein